MTDSDEQKPDAKGAQKETGAEARSKQPVKQSKLNKALSQRAPRTSSSKRNDEESSSPVSSQLKAPGNTAVSKDKEAFKVILVDEIAMGPNPRVHIDPHEFESLCESVSETGVLQPIVCRIKDDPDNPSVKYELVAGQRRFLAAKKVGLSSIPAAVRVLTDEQAYSIAVSENTNRVQMLPNEILAAYEHLVALGLSRNKLNAALGGKTKVSKLKKISESPYWRELIIEGKVSVKGAYEGATGAAAQQKTPISDIVDPDSVNAVDGESAITGEEEPQKLDHVERNTPPPQSAPNTHKPKKCLKATLRNNDGSETDGFIVLSELSFVGEGSKFVAFYPENGEPNVVPLEQLLLKNACVL